MQIFGLVFFINMSGRKHVNKANGKENSSAQSNAILGPVINGVRRPISDSIILQSNQRPPPSTKSQNAARDIGITIPELKGAGPKIKTRDGNKVHLKELIKSKEVKVSPPVEVDQNSDRHLDNEPNHEPNDEMIQYFAALMLEDAQAVRSVSFHPGGKFLAVGANSKILRICKVSNVNSHYGNVTGSLQVVFKRPKYHRGSIYSMGWSPDGRLLATGSNDKSIKVLQFDEHNLSQVNEEIELNVHQGTIRELMFVPNRDAILVSGGAGDGNINVSDIISQKVIGSLHGHTGNVLTVYAGENNLVASGGADNTLRLWDLRCERCIDVVMVGESSPASVALTEKYLAAGQEDGSILLYDVTAGRTMQNFRLHQSDCRSVRFSPDLNYLLTSSYDGTMSLMHLKKNLDKTLPKHYVVAQHEDKVIQCRWHPTENMFLSSSADRTAVLWTAVP